MNRYIPTHKAPFLPPIAIGQVWIQKNGSHGAYIIEEMTGPKTWGIRRLLSPSSEIYLPLEENTIYGNYRLSHE